MTRRALVIAVVLCGCVFGSRPGLPDHDDSGTGATNFSDASDPTRANDAAAMPPSADAAVDAGVWGGAGDASRDVADAARDGGCPVGDAPDAGDVPDGDAPDVPDAPDAALPCEGSASRPPIGVEALR